MTLIGVEPRDLATVEAILHTHVPDHEVRAFGSRVGGKPRKFSDLDLAVMTDKPLDLMRLGQLRDAFSDSDLPFKVDVIDWAATTDPFRRIVVASYVVIQPGPAREELERVKGSEPSR